MPLVIILGAGSKNEAKKIKSRFDEMTDGLPFKDKITKIVIDAEISGNKTKKINQIFYLGIPKPVNPGFLFAFYS